MKTEQKSITEQIDDALLKLFYLSLKINRHSKRCVFFNLSGHVEVIDLQLLNDKKHYGYMPVRSEVKITVKDDVHIFNSDSEDRLSKIECIIEIYEQVLKEDKIPYDLLYPVESITSYEI